jgi:hypothetical protein
MAFLVERAGFRIGEVPITFVNRTEGASKINKREIYKAMYTIRAATHALPALGAHHGRLPRAACGTLTRHSSSVIRHSSSVRLRASIFMCDA